MAYSKTPWVNGTPPPIDATNLNNIEDGIYNAHEMATGRGHTLIVAANDSTALEKQQADYVCTGTADQTTAQTAITAAGAGEVHFMQGTYNFGSYITTVSGLTLSGSGATLRLSNSTNGPIIRVAHNNVTIKDITLDGNGANQTSGNGLIEVTSNSDNLIIDHIHFKNAWNSGLYSLGSSGSNRLDGLRMSYCSAKDFYNGITHQCAIAYISYAKNIQIDHCTMDNFRHNANYADGVKVIHATNVHISHLLITNITGHGIFVGYGSEDVQISDIVFKSDVGYTLESVCVEFAEDGATNGVGRSKRVAINNVSHYSAAGGNNGLYLETCDDLSVSNCVVEIATVAIVNPHYAIRYIDGGKFTNCTSRGLFANDSSGFWIDHCDEVGLSNCAAVDSPVWGWVNIPRAGVDINLSENTIISGCTFRDLPTDGIHITSHDIKVAGCIFENMGVYAGWHAWGIHIKPNYNFITIINNTFNVGAAGVMKGTYTESNNDDCLVSNNEYNSLVVAHITGVGCDRLVMRNNVGFVTESSGSDTLLAASTSKVVTHSLDVTPAAGDIIVTPMETWGNMTKFWIDTYTSTQFYDPCRYQSWSGCRLCMESDRAVIY